MNYTLEIEIEKPRERIVELFEDPEKIAFWQPGFIRIEPISGDPGKAGSKSRLLYENHGRDVELIETIKTNNLPDEFSATYEAKNMRIVVRNRFEEAGPEKTRWISDNEGQVSGLLMRLMTIVMPGCFRKESLKYMENFKAFAETGADCRESAD